jgi:hypothetical protein
MQDKEAHSTASLVAKKDTMQGIAPNRREGLKQKPTSLTLTQRKIWCMKEAKRKAAE